MNNKQTLIEHLRSRIIEKLNENNGRGQPVTETITLAAGGYAHPMALDSGDELFGDQVRAITRHLQELHEAGHLHEIVIHDRAMEGEEGHGEPGNAGISRQIIGGHGLEDYVHEDFIRDVLSGNYHGVSVLTRHGAVTPVKEKLPHPVDPETVRGNRDPQATRSDDHHGDIVAHGLAAFHPQTHGNTDWEGYARREVDGWNQHHGA